MTPLPQYMASSAPDVLEAVRENMRRRKTFFVAIREWADEFGCDSAGFMSSHEGLRVTDLPIKPEGRGDWTKAFGGWRPFKSNKAEWERISEITVAWLPVPGLPANVWSEEDPNGSRFRMFPQPVECDGVAWVGYPHPPAREKRNGEMDPRWVEVLASEYAAAQKAYDEGAPA